MVARELELRPLHSGCETCVPECSLTVFLPGKTRVFGPQFRAKTEKWYWSKYCDAGQSRLT